MIVDGKVHRVVQLGTVMTKPSYQQRGYISKLMTLVLEDVQSADFVYVFANKNVLELYRKLGFKQRRQAKFRLQTKDLHVQPTDVKKLDMTEPKARALLYEMLMHRMPVSLVMGMLQNETTVMYHALTAYKESIYYVPSLQTIVIAQEIAETLHIIDVISKRPVHVLDVLQQLPITLPTIKLGFTPDMLSVVQQTPLLVGDTLFVKVQNDCIYPDDVRFPVSGLA